MDEKTKTKSAHKVSINGYPNSNKRTVTVTQSCPPMRRPSVPAMKPTSKSTSCGNGVQRSVPSSIRRGSSGEGSVVGSYKSTAEVEMQGLESATSSSPLHGMILVSIMLCSLAAFICSKLRDPCEDSYITTQSCSMAVALYFSVINISSCVFSFIIYFLHLIGQCDYISWSAKRKVALEIFITAIIMFTIFIALVLLLLTTVAIHYPITVVGAAFSGLALLCYALRISFLLRETRMLSNKPKAVATENHVRDSNTLNAMKSSLKSYSFDHHKQKVTNNSSSSTRSSRNSAPALVVLSFVKPRKNSFESTNSPQVHETPFLSEELEDDVFINQ